MTATQRILELVTSTLGKKHMFSALHRDLQCRVRPLLEVLEDRCVPASASRFGISIVGAGKLMVQALDSQNNVDTNFTGTVHFSTADATATLPVDYTFKASDLGIAIVVGFAIGKKKLPVTATQVQRPGVTGSLQTGGYTFGGLDPFSAFAQSGVLPGVPFSLTVSNSNLGGSPYTGTIHFESSDPASSLPADYTFSSIDLTQGGNFSTHVFTNLVLNTPGPQTIYISVSSNVPYYVPVAVGPYFLTTTNPPANTDILANKTFQFKAIASLNGISTGYSGKVRFVSSDPLAILPKDYQFTSHDQGVKTFPITFRTAGIQQVQIIDTVTNTMQGSSSLLVDPGPLSRFIVAAPQKVSAGNSYSIKIIPVDAFNNSVFNIYGFYTPYRGTFSISSTYPEAGLPGSYTFQANQQMQEFTIANSRPKGQQIFRVMDQANNKLRGQAIVNLIEKPALKVASPKLNTPVSATLSDTQIASILAEALQRWQTAGVDVSSLQAVQVRTMNFGDRQTVAQSAGNTIWLDDNAAGWGWFVDSTPSDNDEFLKPLTAGVYNRIDLLTAISHEIGHMLGLDDSNLGVMSRTIAPGKRNSPK